MKTGRYSLKDLLTHNEIEQIIVPEIQRDYVWKDSNVKKLLESILNNFSKKEKVTLEIKIKGDKIKEDSILSYLQTEYEKLKYNLKIGFIYAYHDSEYAGKFFLIDGQQRITTLYLLLLALYTKKGIPEDFKALYFKENRLKLDYKVREASHDFLLEFVKCQLGEQDIEIEESVKFYKSEYGKDETIKNMLHNYEIIKDEVGKLNDINGFIDYVENFIELNYFDTHLSEQGEQLYIYMNSRGESLSYQEIIRAEIVNKESNPEKKKEIGIRWEEWQNFFWINKGKNENADVGFEEFLKWATIIHICTSDNPDIIRKNNYDKAQTLRESKGNYIHRINYLFEEQKNFLSHYQIKNIDANFLQEIFNAVRFIFEQKSKYLPVKKEWLSNSIITLDYMVLCPLIYYVSKKQCSDPPLKVIDVERLAMFLKNLTYFESIYKNPDSATIDTIELVKELCNLNQKDIIYLNIEGYKNILTGAEKYKLTEYIKPNSEREILEKFVWDITLNEKLSKFLEGDISILFDCINYDIQYNKEKDVYSKDDVSALELYKVIFEKNILQYCNNDLLRRALLTFGDYSIDDNGGSWHFHNKFDRYSFLQNENEWRVLFKEEKESSPSQDAIIYPFLSDLKNEYLQPNFSATAYFENRIQAYNGNDWAESFIKNPSVLAYCGNKKFLWPENGEPQRIILLSSIKANNACEIQCHLLKENYSNENMWIQKHNICVIDIMFDKKNEKLVHDENAYSLSVKYENAIWSFTLFHKDEIQSNLKLKPFIKHGWVKGDDFVTKQNGVLVSNDSLKSIKENVAYVKEKLDDLIIEITDILKQKIVK